MIVNYDSDNGWSTFLTNFSTIPQISKEVENALSKLPYVNMDIITSAKDLGDIVGYTSDDFYEFAKNADMSGNLLSQYQSHLESAAKSTSTFSNITKTAGSALKTLGAFTLNMVATMAIEKVFEIGAK